MIAFDRPVKFEEVDAANIVFFARFVTYAHEAMEHFFGALRGGYAGLILERRVGFPAVHVEMAFTAPARYGDVLRIETRVARIGNRSAVFWYRMVHAGAAGRAHAAPARAPDPTVPHGEAARLACEAQAHDRHDRPAHRSPPARCRPTCARSSPSTSGTSGLTRPGGGAMGHPRRADGGRAGGS